jgi:hypothetical protein
MRMRNWMEGHTWRAPDGPPEDAVRPHVLVLPHDQPEVLAYFDSVRQVVNPYVDIVAPVAEPDLHWTVQGAQSRDATGAYVGSDLLGRAAELLQKELSRLDPFDVIVGPTASNRSAVLTRIMPTDQQGDDPTVQLRLAAREP